MVTRLKDSIHKPKNQKMLCILHKLFQQHDVELITFAEATNYYKWMVSMKEEYDTLIKNGT